MERIGNNTDEPNDGRPKRALNESNVATVAKLVNEDSHIYTREVGARLSLSFEIVKRILHTKLHI